MSSVALAAVPGTATAATSLVADMLHALRDRSPGWLVSGTDALALGAGADDTTGAAERTIELPGSGLLGVDGPQWVRAQLATALEPHLQTPVTPAALAGLLSTIVGDCHCVAILDPHTCLAYRGPMSPRPLFYAADDGPLLVASQIRAITTVWPPEVDPAGLAPFLVPQLCDPTGSARHGIRRLPPGHLLTWRAGHVDVRQVSQVAPVDVESASQEELVAEFRHRLLAAVARCSAPPDGVLLSGGIDSSALTCAYVALGYRDGRAYALTYDDQLAPCDERRFVDDVERATRITVSRLDGNRLLPLVAPNPVGDEPEPWAYASRNWGMLRHIARSERPTATVLAGEGGDELLLGQVFAVADRHARGDQAGAAREIRTFPDPHRTARAVRGLLTGAYDAAGARIMRALDDVPSWLTATYLADTGVVDRLAVGYPHLGPTGSLTATYSRAVLADMGAAGRVQCGGWHEDMGRQLGLTITYPFLDPDLAALVWALPPELMRDQGLEKVVLREALADLLPLSVARRADKADALAMLHAGLGEQIDLVRRVAHGGPLADLKVIQPERLLAAVDQYLAGDRSVAPALWTTVAVDTWLTHHDQPNMEQLGARRGARS